MAGLPLQNRAQVAGGSTKLRADKSAARIVKPGHRRSSLMPHCPPIQHSGGRSPYEPLIARLGHAYDEARVVLPDRLRCDVRGHFGLQHERRHSGNASARRRAAHSQSGADRNADAQTDHDAVTDAFAVSIVDTGFLTSLLRRVVITPHAWREPMMS